MQKRMLLTIGLLVCVIFTLGSVWSLTRSTPSKKPVAYPNQQSSSPTPGIALRTSPEQKILANDYHIFQSFNNCGPAALSMALSYYSITESQENLGQALRPYQNPQGDNDDKSVTLAELAEKAKEYNLIPYHRPNGTSTIIKQFISYDMPVITRTWLKPGEDIGHYRVIKGYNDTTKEFIQDDSLQGKNLRYTYDNFDVLWETFNYEYLVLVPKDKQTIAEAILGENADEKIAWKNAVISAEKILQENPEDIDARFNLSIASYHTGEYQRSTEEFEKVEYKLSSRTLWYQIEPIQAYAAIKNYDKVFAMTNHILNNHNRAFSELYLIRGAIYKEQGKTAEAKAEFEKAIYYNENLESAKEALALIQ